MLKSENNACKVNGKIQFVIDKHFNMVDTVCFAPHNTSADFSKTNDIANLNRKEIPLFLNSFSSEELNKYLLIKRGERVVIVEKIRLELGKRNEFVTRRRLKSKNFQGKGGLSNIIVEFLLDKFN